jgi:hypothetical protein
MRARAAVGWLLAFGIRAEPVADTELVAFMWAIAREVQPV